MPSEQRLHPASVLFSLAASVKTFALPGLLVLLSAGRSSGGGDDGRFGWLPSGWEFWLMLLLIPSALAAVARYLTYRIRYEGAELVIRSGILFRSERHVPYARIQNLDAVQNVFHRALGVVEVRVETGGGREPEARISVLPESAFEEMRRRVFAARRDVAPTPSDAAEGAPDASDVPRPRTLLHLPLRELLLFGLLENRGFVVIGAVYGVAWELGLLEPLFGSMFIDGSYIRSVVRSGVFAALASGGATTIAALGVLAGGLAVLLIAVRAISMAWGAVRLHDFRLTKAGEDLHTRFGLFTRVARTIPLQRVQTLTIHEGPLHRMRGRVAVHVETAGSTQPGSGGHKAEREWLAPLIRREDVNALASDVMTELDLGVLEWRRPHPGAFRRAAVRHVIVAVSVTVFLMPWVGRGAAVLLPVTVLWALVVARKHVDHLAWAATDRAVAFRSGWLWRRTTIARVTKIQAVTRVESPFDRRVAMARVRVDTAGRGERSHPVDIPYLGVDTAVDLHRTLAKQAARTVFSIR